MLLASEHGPLRALRAEGEAPVLRAILAELGRSRLLEAATRLPAVRSGLFRLVEGMLPGIMAHYLVRKRWIEGAVREAIDGGITQVVILGAGFDTLAARLQSEFADVLFLELDHPATQEVKRRGLGSATGVRLVPVDLGTTSLRDAFAAVPDFSMTLPSILVAEGLTMYLPPDRIRALFREVAGAVTAGGRFVFTFMEPDPAGALAFRGESRLVKRWLAWKREPFLWGCHRKDLGALLAECGLDPWAIIDDRDLRERFLCPRGLEGIPLARGECLCLCAPAR